MTDQTDPQKEFQDSFLAEATEMLQCIEGLFLELEKSNYDPKIFDQLFRLAHNIKGTGKLVGFEEISIFAHELESLLVLIRTGNILISPPVIELLLFCGDKLKEDVALLQSNPKTVLDHHIILGLIKATIENTPHVNLQANSASLLESALPAPNNDHKNNLKVEQKREIKEEYVRISLNKIDDLLNNFGEQVILQSVLDHSKFNLAENAELLVRTINQLSKLTYDLQQTAITLRMVSLKNLFLKMERGVRDTAVCLKKQIEFQTDGSENELDKTIVDSLSDSLTHMIRNSVDHGIETEEERKLSGKPLVGKVSLRGYRRGGLFYIQIEDDGRGLDPDKIFKKAVKMGLIKDTSELSKDQIYDLIFENGFSTKDAVSDISGRGVGMNVVRETLNSIKGECQIESVIGKGTTFTIKVPLTLSIFNGIIVKVEGIQYVIPSSEVQEVISVPVSNYRNINTREFCIQIRNSVLPVVDLKKVLKMPASPHHRAIAHHKDTLLIIKTPLGKCAMIVDELISQQKIVHKSLGPETRHIQGATGVTILGDGSVALILDLSNLRSAA
jgi:two-component system chemotaxis sensor kinase CheA